MELLDYTAKKTNQYCYDWYIDYSGADFLSQTFSGTSPYSSEAVTWYYKLTKPTRSHQSRPISTNSIRYGNRKLVAFAGSAFAGQKPVYADIEVICDNNPTEVLKTSGLIKANSQIGEDLELCFKFVPVTLQMKFTLREDSHHTIPGPVAQLLNHYESLLSCSKFSDVTLVVGKEKFSAHKAILAARCPVFAAMFEHEMQEARENQVMIKDIKHEVFMEVLRYIYTGTVPKMELMANDLLMAAERYALDSLKTMCERYLASKLSVETAAMTMCLADLYRADELKQEAINFIADNLKNMKETDWKSVIASNPDAIADMIARLAEKETRQKVTQMSPSSSFYE